MAEIGSEPLERRQGIATYVDREFSSPARKVRCRIPVVDKLFPHSPLELVGPLSGRRIYRIQAADGGIFRAHGFVHCPHDQATQFPRFKPLFIEALSCRASSNGAAQTSLAAVSKAHIDEAHSVDCSLGAAVVGIVEVVLHAAAQAEAVASTTTTRLNGVRQSSIRVLRPRAHATSVSQGRSSSLWLSRSARATTDLESRPL